MDIIAFDHIILYLFFTFLFFQVFIHHMEKLVPGDTHK